MDTKKADVSVRVSYDTYHKLRVMAANKATSIKGLLSILANKLFGNKKFYSDQDYLDK